MDSEDYFGWCNVQLTVKDRLKDNSLTHTFSLENKYQKSTLLLNKELKKFPTIQEHSEFIQRKKKILKKLKNNGLVSDDSEYSDSDLKKYYQSFDCSCIENLDASFRWNTIEKNTLDNDSHIWEPTVDINVVECNKGASKIRNVTKMLQQCAWTDEQSTNEIDFPIYENHSNQSNVKDVDFIVNNLSKKNVTKKSVPKPISNNKIKFIDLIKSVNSKLPKCITSDSKLKKNKIDAKEPELSEEDDLNEEFTPSQFQAQSTQIFSDTFSETTPKLTRRSNSKSRLSHSEMMINQPRDSGIEEDSREDKTNRRKKITKKNKINDKLIPIEEEQQFSESKFVDKDKSQSATSKKTDGNNENDINGNAQNIESTTSNDEKEIISSNECYDLDDYDNGNETDSENKSQLIKKNLVDGNSTDDENSENKFDSQRQTKKKLKTELKRSKSPHVIKMLKELKELRLLTDSQDDSEIELNKIKPKTLEMTNNKKDDEIESDDCDNFMDIKEHKIIMPDDFNESKNSDINESNKNNKKDETSEIDNISPKETKRLEKLKRLNFEESEEESEEEENNTIKNVKSPENIESSDIESDNDIDENDELSPSNTQRFSQYRRMNLLNNNSSSSSSEDEKDVEKNKTLVQSVVNNLPKDSELDLSDSKDSVKSNISKISHKSEIDHLSKNESKRNDAEDFVDLDDSNEVENIEKSMEDKEIIPETQESVNTQQNDLESQEMFSSLEDLSTGLNLNKLNEDFSPKNINEEVNNQTSAALSKEIFTEKITEISQLIEKENLIKGSYESTMIFDDISADEELFVIEVPKTIFNTNLIGEKLILSKTQLQLGEKKFKIFKKKSLPTFSCISKKSVKDSFEIINIRPVVSIVAQGKTCFNDDESMDVVKNEISGSEVDYSSSRSSLSNHNNVKDNHNHKDKTLMRNSTVKHKSVEKIKDSGINSISQNVKRNLTLAINKVQKLNIPKTQDIDEDENIEIMEVITNNNNKTNDIQIVEEIIQVENEKKVNEPLRKKCNLKIIGEEKIVKKYKIVSNKDKVLKPSVNEKNILQSESVYSNQKVEIIDKNVDTESQSIKSLNLKEKEEATDEDYHLHDDGSSVSSKSRFKDESDNNEINKTNKNTKKISNSEKINNIDKIDKEEKYESVVSDTSQQSAEKEQYIQNESKEKYKKMKKHMLSSSSEQSYEIETQDDFTNAIDNFKKTQLQSTKEFENEEHINLYNKEELQNDYNEEEIEENEMSSYSRKRLQNVRKLDLFANDESEESENDYKNKNEYKTKTNINESSTDYKSEVEENNILIKETKKSKISNKKYSISPSSQKHIQKEENSNLMYNHENSHLNKDLNDLIKSDEEDEEANEMSTYSKKRLQKVKKLDLFVSDESEESEDDFKNNIEYKIKTIQKENYDVQKAEKAQNKIQEIDESSTNDKSKVEKNKSFIKKIKKSKISNKKYSISPISQKNIQEEKNSNSLTNHENSRINKDFNDLIKSDEEDEEANEMSTYSKKRLQTVKKLDLFVSDESEESEAEHKKSFESKKVPNKKGSKNVQKAEKAQNKDQKIEVSINDDKSELEENNKLIKKNKKSKIRNKKSSILLSSQEPIQEERNSNLMHNHEKSHLNRDVDNFIEDDEEDKETNEMSLHSKKRLQKLKKMDLYANDKSEESENDYKNNSKYKNQTNKNENRDVHKADKTQNKVQQIDESSNDNKSEVEEKTILIKKSKKSKIGNKKYSISPSSQNHVQEEKNSNSITNHENSRINKDFNDLIKSDEGDEEANEMSTYSKKRLQTIKKLDLFVSDESEESEDEYKKSFEFKKMTNKKESKDVQKTEKTHNKEQEIDESSNDDKSEAEENNVLIKKTKKRKNNNEIFLNSPSSQKHIQQKRNSNLMTNHENSRINKDFNDLIKSDEEDEEANEMSTYSKKRLQTVKKLDLYASDKSDESENDYKNNCKYKKQTNKNESRDVSKAEKTQNRVQDINESSNDGKSEVQEINTLIKKTKKRKIDNEKFLNSPSSQKHIQQKKNLNLMTNHENSRINKDVNDFIQNNDVDEEANEMSSHSKKRLQQVTRLNLYASDKSDESENDYKNNFKYETQTNKNENRDLSKAERTQNRVQEINELSNEDKSKVEENNILNKKTKKRKNNNEKFVNSPSSHKHIQKQKDFHLMINHENSLINKDVNDFKKNDEEDEEANKISYSKKRLQAVEKLNTFVSDKSENSENDYKKSFEHKKKTNKKESKNVQKSTKAQNKIQNIDESSTDDKSEVEGKYSIPPSLQEPIQEERNSNLMHSHENSEINTDVNNFIENNEKEKEANEMSSYSKKRLQQMKKLNLFVSDESAESENEYKKCFETIKETNKNGNKDVKKAEKMQNKVQKIEVSIDDDKSELEENNILIKKNKKSKIRNKKSSIVPSSQEPIQEERNSNLMHNRVKSHINTFVDDFIADDEEVKEADAISSHSKTQLQQVKKLDLFLIDETEESGNEFKKTFEHKKETNIKENKNVQKAEKRQKKVQEIDISSNNEISEVKENNIGTKNRKKNEVSNKKDPISSKSKKQGQKKKNSSLMHNDEHVDEYTHNSNKRNKVDKEMNENALKRIQQMKKLDLYTNDKSDESDNDCIQNLEHRKEIDNEKSNDIKNAEKIQFKVPKKKTETVKKTIKNETKKNVGKKKKVDGELKSLNPRNKKLNNKTKKNCKTGSAELAAKEIMKLFASTANFNKKVLNSSNSSNDSFKYSPLDIQWSPVKRRRYSSTSDEGEFMRRSFKMRHKDDESLEEPSTSSMFLNDSAFPERLLKSDDNKKKRRLTKFKVEDEDSDNFSIASSTINNSQSGAFIETDLEVEDIKNKKKLKKSIYFDE